MLSQRIYSYADVPYRIRAYAQILENPYATIDFDWGRAHAVAARVAEVGDDGKLMVDDGGCVIHVTLAEKLLVLILVKLTNFVPEGGVWMNTQRPEWNDANNALVGKGLSVGTAAYLRRMLVFCQHLFARGPAILSLTLEVRMLLAAVAAILAEHEDLLTIGFDDTQRRAIMDALGLAGSDYRTRIYRVGCGDTSVSVQTDEILSLLALALRYIDQTLRANQRPDGLYHAYNILQLRPGSARVGRLYAMLEGQVAILSSGLFDGVEALAVLRSLRASALYRADQHSYMLYPDRDVPGFLVKNNVPAAQVQALPLVAALVARNDRTLLVRDEDGVFHFNGAFRNVEGVATALAQLRRDPALTTLVAQDGPHLLALFEATFDHQSFTGRSGTFFAYEGLGSIYWHMVAKLLLAVQENFWWARTAGADAATLDALRAMYDDIRAGIGFNKTPEVYGAFPTDPYSHTPKGQGAKQPGMTGQVKEEILTRLGELGVQVQDGALGFRPVLLHTQELLTEAALFVYLDIDGVQQTLTIPAGALAFTFCQTPIILMRSTQPRIEIIARDGRVTEFVGDQLDQATSQRIFQRAQSIHHLRVYSHWIK